MSFYNWLGTFLGTRETWLSKSFKRLKRLGWKKAIAIAVTLFLLLKAAKSFLFWPFIVGVLIVYFVTKKVHSRIIKVAFLTLTLPIISILGLFLLVDLVSPLNKTEKDKTTQIKIKKEASRITTPTHQPKTVKTSPSPIPEEKRIEELINNVLKGKNNRGIEYKKSVEITQSASGGYKVEVGFNADDNFTKGMIKSSIEKKMSEIYIALYQSPYDIESVACSGCLISNNGQVWQ